MEQVRLAELLEDKVFSQWFHTPPEEDTVVTQHKRWAVWYQEDRNGPWLLKRFKSWKKAHKWVSETLPWLWDATVADVAHPHRPPLLKQKTGRRHPRTNAPLYRRFWWPFPATVDMVVNTHGVGHYWCPFCRRPTVFRFYHKGHHAFGDRPTIGWDLRCTICGVRRVFIRDYYHRWGGK